MFTSFSWLDVKPNYFEFCSAKEAILLLSERGHWETKILVGPPYDIISVDESYLFITVCFNAQLGVPSFFAVMTTNEVK